MKRVFLFIILLVMTVSCAKNEIFKVAKNLTISGAECTIEMNDGSIETIFLSEPTEIHIDKDTINVEKLKNVKISTKKISEEEITSKSVQASNVHFQNFEYAFEIENDGAYFATLNLNLELPCIKKMSPNAYIQTRITELKADLLRFVDTEPYSLYRLDFTFEVLVNKEVASTIEVSRYINLANTPISFDASVEDYENVDTTVQL